MAWRVHERHACPGSSSHGHGDLSRMLRAEHRSAKIRRLVYGLSCSQDHMCARAGGQRHGLLSCTRLDSCQQNQATYMRHTADEVDSSIVPIVFATCASTMSPFEGHSAVDDMARLFPSAPAKAAQNVMRCSARRHTQGRTVSTQLSVTWVLFAPRRYTATHSDCKQELPGGDDALQWHPCSYISSTGKAYRLSCSVASILAVSRLMRLVWTCPNLVNRVLACTECTRLEISTHAE